MKATTGLRGGKKETNIIGREKVWHRKKLNYFLFWYLVEISKVEAHIFQVVIDKVLFDLYAASLGGTNNNSKISLCHTNNIVIKLAAWPKAYFGLSFRASVKQSMISMTLTVLGTKRIT